MAVIWITHDLGIIAGLAQRVMVMYGGCFIEEAPVKELYADPRHPYTIGLLGSLPRVDAEQRRSLASIDGLPPVLFEKPARARSRRAASSPSPGAGRKTRPLEEIDPRAQGRLLGEAEAGESLSMASDLILRVENLVKHFPSTRVPFRRETRVVHAVDGVSFDLAPG